MATMQHKSFCVREFIKTESAIAVQRAFRLACVEAPFNVQLSPSFLITLYNTTTSSILLPIFNPFQFHCLLYVPTDLSLEKLYLCSRYSDNIRATISLCNIHRVVSLMTACFVLCEVRTKSVL